MIKHRALWIVLIRVPEATIPRFWKILSYSTLSFTLIFCFQEKIGGRMHPAGKFLVAAPPDGRALWLRHDGLSSLFFFSLQFRTFRSLTFILS